MSSSYFGEPNMGSGGNNERGSGSSSSSSSPSRKGKKKKNDNSDKPKQPQRGLGVAQLEKIRLQTANYSTIPASISSFSYATTSSSTTSSVSYGGFPQNIMGLPDYERTSIRYGGDHTKSTNTVRWAAGNAVVEAQPFVQPSMTRHLLNLHDSQHENTNKHRSNSMGSSSQNSDSSDNQELDLELRLSLG